jgi:hypothetical protein
VGGHGGELQWARWGLHQKSWALLLIY